MDILFQTYEDMTNVKDSAQFNSDTEICSLTVGNYDVSIETRGEVSVYFDGKKYCCPLDFPQELKDIIANEDKWTLNDRVEVDRINWFELFVREGDDPVPYSEIIDIEKCTDKELFEQCVVFLTDEGVAPILSQKEIEQYKSDAFTPDGKLIEGKQQQYYWENPGDPDIFNEGGTLVRETKYSGEYEFFNLVVDNIDGEAIRYAFHGYCNLADEADDGNKLLKEIVEEDEYDSIEALIAKDPYYAVSRLISLERYGAMEFGARNFEGQGEYSLDYADFKVTDEQLVGFMRELNLPEKYIPELSLEKATIAQTSTAKKPIDSPSLD